MPWSVYNSNGKLLQGLVIADDSIVEGKLDVSNAPTNGQFLQAQAGEGGGLTWAAAPGAGKIGQVVQVYKQDSFSTSSNSFVDVTGLSVAITPTATSSKVLVHYTLNGAQDHDGNRAYFKLVRGSTNIMVGDTSGTSRIEISGEFASAHDTIMDSTAGGTYLDSPSTTSSITYKVQLMVGGGAGSSVYINRPHSWGNNSSTGAAASTIVLMEVLA